MRFEWHDFIGAFYIDRLLPARVCSAVVLGGATVVARHSTVGTSGAPMLCPVALVSAVSAVSSIVRHGRRIDLCGAVQATRSVTKCHGTGRHGNVHPRNERQQQRTTRC